MPRIEFNKKTKRAAYERANGLCERCGALLMGKVDYEYDHSKPCAFGGDGSLENCLVLCRACHSAKTTKEDIPAIAKSDRIRDRAAGIRRNRRITAWRSFSGEIVRKSRDRGE